MYFLIAPPGPKISAIVGFFRSGVASRGCIRSGCGDAAATVCEVSLARLGIGRRMRVMILEIPRTDKIAHPGGTRRFAILAAMAKAAAAPKKLFLVDAMGFIFSVYFAPMLRLTRR